MNDKLNIGYFADGPWSHEAFNTLVADQDISVSFICARHKTQDKILKRYSKLHGIDFFSTENVNSEEFLDKLKLYECDLFVSMSYDQFFGKEIRGVSRYGIINCHAGKLPSYRGRNVLNWVLINGEKEFGITVHYVDGGIDTGDVILQEVNTISESDDYSTLLNRSYVACAELLYRAIVLFKDGKPLAKKQSDIGGNGFYCTKRQEGDEYINWNDLSADIFNFSKSALPSRSSQQVIVKWT